MEIEVVLRDAQCRQGQLQRLIKEQGGSLEGTDGLRSAIREGYEQVLLHSPELASEHDVDHALWKHCFYVPIEHYRTAMRRAARAATRACGGAGAGSTGDDSSSRRSGKGPKLNSGGGRGGDEAGGEAGAAARSELAAVQREFQGVSAEASAFYHGLIRRLEGAYRTHATKATQAAQAAAQASASAGRPRDGSALTAPAAADGGASGQGLRRRLVTLSRCWIYLGDIARYKEVRAPSLMNASARSRCHMPSCAPCPP